MENGYTVYRHICPNNKMYIGITRKKPEDRFLNGQGYFDNKKFYKDITKYGWDNIKHEILFENLSRKLALCIESIYIVFYNTCNEYNGYNSREYSSNGKTTLKESKTRIVVNIDKDKYEKVKEMAAKEGRSVSNYINYLIDKEIKKSQEK